MENINTYEEFKSAVIESLSDYLPKQFNGSTIEIKRMEKNNKTYDSLVIKPSGSNIAPSLHMDSLFEDFKRDDKDIREFLMKLGRSLENIELNPFDVSQITEWEAVRDKILPRVVSIDNKSYLSDKVFLPKKDMAVLFTIRLDGEHGIPVTKQVFECWKNQVSPEEMFDIAIKNQRENNPPEFMSMFETMKKMMMPNLIEEFGSEEAARNAMPELPGGNEMMYIISNQSRVHGAAVILDDEFLNHVHEKVGDFYILPSSIHECIVISKNTDISLENLYAMVSEVNNGEVLPEERLTYSVYRYDSNHELSLATEPPIQYHAVSIEFGGERSEVKLTKEQSEILREYAFDENNVGAIQKMQNALVDIPVTIGRDTVDMSLCLHELLHNCSLKSALTVKTPDAEPFIIDMTGANKEELRKIYNKYQNRNAPDDISLSERTRKSTWIGIDNAMNPPQKPIRKGKDL